LPKNLPASRPNLLLGHKITKKNGTRKLFFEKRYKKSPSAEGLTGTDGLFLAKRANFLTVQRYEIFAILQTIYQNLFFNCFAVVI